MLLVIDALNKLGVEERPLLIHVYKNIPHEKLLKIRNELIDFCFIGADGELISANGQKEIRRNSFY